MFIEAMAPMIADHGSANYEGLCIAVLPSVEVAYRLLPLKMFIYFYYYYYY